MIVFNLICVCKKFQETTEKLRFNPILITLLKLFSKIQTQYLYSKTNTKIDRIENYEIIYEVTCDKYLKFKEENYKYHNVLYTEYNKTKYGDIIPNEVNILNDYCFENCSSLETIELPSTIKKLRESCFSYYSSLKSINIPSTIKILCYKCFYLCTSLQSVDLPLSLTTLIAYCFDDCKSLTSVNLPSMLQSLNDGIFFNCNNLLLINLSRSLEKIRKGCFKNCSSLTSINLTPKLMSIEEKGFKNCSNLQSINDIKEMKIGKECFSGCDKLEIEPKNYNYIIS
ncbi:hypothetical protein QTN25_002236 [Entamoeba marina]